MSQAVRVPADALHDFTTRALRAVGVTAEHATVIADVLVMTDSCGTFTHGTKLLIGYLKRYHAGGLEADKQPEIIGEGPAFAIIDGHSVSGHVTSVFAMKQAILRAKTCGLAYAGVQNSCHFAAAGYYSALAAREGLIGISMANDIPSVAGPGSRRAVLGTNPLSFAIPTGTDEPILLDMALSTVAGGKVYAAHQRGEPIPDNWIIDNDGKPTTDGSLYPGQASLAPLGNHKGYGLSLLVETLAGVLSGAAITWGVKAWMHDDPAEPTQHGGAFLAIDVESIMPREQFNTRISHLIDELRAAPTADGVERVLLPGDLEWARRRDALKHGIVLPPDVVQCHREVSTEFGVAADWL